MVERDEDSRNGKRINGTDRKQQPPPTFVNHFAKFMESRVSYAEALRLGPAKQGNLRLYSVQRDSGTNTAVPSQSDGNLSRSCSTPSFDSSAPSTPSLPHSISSPDLEGLDSQAEKNDSLSGYDYPNPSSPASTERSNSDPSALAKSRTPLYFGKLKSSLALPKSFPYQYSSTGTSSNGKPPTPPPPPPPRPSPLSCSDSLREELQRLIKRAMESGSLQRQCAKCGDSHHCCGQTLLEAVSSIPPTSSTDIS